MLAADETPLDNPLYEALRGPHASFAEVRGQARRYPADVAPFLGLPSSPSPQDWRDAGELLGPTGYVAVLADSGELPSAWQVMTHFDLVQMVGEEVSGRISAEAVRLGASDVPEMLELVALTEPGPFLPRTVELGEYLGIRREGTLLAMAGERLRLNGWTEVSAVCTRPECRGQGLASVLVGALIDGIQRRSERVFLHVLATNTGAIRLYEQLGFRVRRTASMSIVRPSSPVAPGS